MGITQIVDRAFAEKFMLAVDSPMEYGVYLLFHDWWEKAPQNVIDAYVDELNAISGASVFLDERHIAEPLSLEQLSHCTPGTLGHGYHEFIVKNNLAANLGTNYREMNEELHKSGKLDRLPADMSYSMIRGFQTHDFHHVLTGYDSSPYGELALQAFYLAQGPSLYQTMRMAITTSHAAYVNPRITRSCMDAIVDGYSYGRDSVNISFQKWEEQIHTPLADIQRSLGLRVTELAE